MIKSSTNALESKRKTADDASAKCNQPPAGSPANAHCLEKSSGYEVGYGKPPAKHQFKSGRSGNPKGRPKGAQGHRAIAKKVLGERQRIRTEMGETTATKFEVMFRQATIKACKGDLRAFDKIYAIAQRLEAEQQDETPLHADPDEASFHLKLIEEFREQVRNGISSKDDTDKPEKYGSPEGLS